MSTPDEIESQTHAEGASTIRSNSKTASSVEAPMDVATSIDQLRSLVCGLGIGLLVVSLALTAFVYKQNRNLIAGTIAHQRQIAQLQAGERSVSYLVNALIQYSSGKPDLMAMLVRHGLQVAPPPSAPPPSAPAKPQPSAPAKPQH
jgi:hypothetical protein